MSKLKIHGNLNPTVGKAESYTIKSLFDLPGIINPLVSPIDNKVKWCIYVLENGKWRETKENKKTGETVSYTFTEKSLSRKGIKIEVQRGFETASEIIKPQRAEEQKILKVELLDSQENKPTKPFAYGQTVVAKVHCTGMEYQMINLTLWEDDAKGAGHSSTNKNNKAITKPAEVKKGIAKASFKLMPSFDKMAKAFQTNGGEGKIHEYYVTASIQDKLSASNNIDVKALEEPIPPVKKKVPVQDPQKPKPNVPKPNAPTTAPKQPVGKKGITKVTLTKTSQTTLSCVVFSNGLQGKEIKFKLYEDDNGSSNDLLIDQKFAINSDSFVINIDLKKVNQSAGGGFWQEGNEQELFVDIEVIETASHHKTDTIDVDITAFKTDPVDDTNKPVKVGEEKKEEEKGKCPNCDKDITLEEIKKICVSKPNKKGEEKCLVESDTVIIAALPYLNEYRKKIGINTCIRKAHFLAQISQETKFYDMQEGFKYTNPERMRGLFYSYFKQFGDKDKQLVEAKRLSDLSLDKKNHPEVANAIYGNKHPMGKNHTDANDGWRYSGKGFKQITWKDNYVALQKYVKETYKIDVEWVGGDNPYKLKNNGKDAILSALAFWGKNGINGVATEISDNSVESVTALINPAKAGIDERKRFFKKAIEVLKVKKCQKEGNVTVNEEKGTVVVVSGKGSKMISNWVVYETNVYFNITLSTFKKLQNENKIPKPDYTTYLSRDAHGDKAKYGKHSDKRYGRANETPPGEYYLIPAVAGQSYKVYLSSDGKSASITGPDGNRDGVAIHQYSPKYAIGCLTTVSGKDTSIVDGFLNILEDLPLRDNRPVRIIIEERKVKEETWSDSSIGTKKWTGIL